MYFCYKSTIYLNQRYLTIKDNKRLYYADYYILGQIIECLNPPEDISNYVCKDLIVKIYRRRYDTVTGTFLGLYETLGYLRVRGNPNEYFFDYGFCKEDSKILYSHHKRRIPSSFSGTFFNRHKVQFERDGLQTPLSKVYYFLPSTTDGSE